LFPEQQEKEQSAGEKRRSSINIYEILEKFITFMQEKKKVSAVSINQYLDGIRSFLAMMMCM
jgi:hypothetical protein